MIQKREVWLSVFVILIMGNFFVWKEIWQWEENLKVIFFDVGEGNSILVETPQKHQILIDGGPYPDINEKLAKHLPFWDKTLDAVILTHPDYDHINGLISVLEKYKVYMVISSGATSESKTYQKWFSLLQEKEKQGAKIINGNKNDYLLAGGSKIEILWPDFLPESYYKNQNRYSLVLKISFGETDFLLMGDVDRTVEEKIKNDFKEEKIEVLGVAHHGSRTANSPVFLEIIKPQWAVISVGKNNQYHHPHEEVLNLLNQFALNLLRTDQYGEIFFSTDGKNVNIK